MASIWGHHCHFLKQPQQHNNRMLSQRWRSNHNDMEDENNDNHIVDTCELEMPNLYQEWTLAQDKRLWKEYCKQQPQVDWTALAVQMGRGLGGVQARLAKLQNVNTLAYERLFVATGNGATKDAPTKPPPQPKKSKLVPAAQVLRRIQWDYMLNEDDFFVSYYDRVDDTVVTRPVTAANDQISGAATRLVDALPEHRIVAICYKERVVWDRDARLDLVLGSGHKEDEDDDETIQSIMETYDEWKQQRDEEQQHEEEQRQQIVTHMRQVLGPEQYALLEHLLLDVEEAQTSNNGETMTPMIDKRRVETWVEQALVLLQTSRNDPDQSLNPTLIPTSDYQALDLLSAWVAVLPQPKRKLSTTTSSSSSNNKTISPLRRVLLEEIHETMEQLLGRPSKPTQQRTKNRPLPELDEADLTETFVRGSGPGGQKVNKTSNRVVLVHNPTQLRVECQLTRSLTQNRKVARKRLRVKLDEYLHGSASKTQVAAQTAASKKKKAKRRNRARQKKRKQLQEQDKM